MSDPRIALYYLSALAGLIMVVGGIWLIYKEKIYIDVESKQPIEIKTPVGSFKNNYPALTLFALGFFPLIYPMYAINNLTDFVKVETVRIKGSVNSHAYPVVIYAARAQDSLTARGEFRLPVPFFGKGEDDYRMLLVVNGRVLGEERATRSSAGGEIEVSFRPVEVEDNPYSPTLSAVPADYR